MAAINYTTDTNSTDISAPLGIVTDTDRGGLVALLAAFSLSLVLVVSVPIRTYVRRSIRTYKLDDYAFLVATLFCFSQASLVFYAVHIGFGKTQSLIDSSLLEPMEKSFLTSDILYICTLALSKLSTAFLFLRLTPGRGHVIVIRATVGISLAWTVASIFLLAFRCHPSHPWTDTVFASECPSLFARWQFIGALDVVTEVALFSISIYVVWGIQMSRISKTLVTGSFGFRIPIIGIVGLRLHYLYETLNSSDPSYSGAPAVCCTQIEIGYSIMASIVPCLKTFMAPYEGPDPNASSYYHSSGNGTNYKLSSLASRSDAEVAGVASNEVSDGDPPPLPTPAAPAAAGTDNYNTQYSGAGKKFLGKLRPEQTIYKARVTHDRGGGGGSGEPRRGVSVDSRKSQKMIIKKGVEWSVAYDSRNPSTGGKDEEPLYHVADEIRSER